MSLKSVSQNLDSPHLKSFSLLTWTHYRTLLQVKDPEARNWYAQEASEQTWSVRTLQRNISSQYYFRLLKSHNKSLVKKEMQEKTSKYQQDKLEFIKSPVIANNNPTLGIVLCADTDEDIARYSILNGNEQLFASKYKTYLPSEEELKAEIEAQKRLFYLQQGEKRENENE